MPLRFRRDEEVVIRRSWACCAAALVFLVFLQGPILASQIPLDLSADSLFISPDQNLVDAEGSVSARLEDIQLSADQLLLEQEAPGRWRFSAVGAVRLSMEQQLELAGSAIAAVIDTSEAGVSIASLEAEGFSGESPFENSEGEEHTIHFAGQSGTVTFDKSGAATLIEVEDVEVSTCDCCSLPLRAQPYAFHAERLLLYPDRLLVAFGLVARVGGVVALWLPVYVQPLDDTLQSPLFPSIGRSSLRGWYLKWNVPFYLSESLFGSVLFDYYSKFHEVAAGLVARYAFADQAGRIRIYSFPAKVGDPEFEFSASHELPSAGAWTGSGSVSYRAVGGSTELDYGAEAQGSSDAWDMSISAVREVEEHNTDDDDETNDVTKTIDRFPDILMSRDPWNAGSLTIRPRFGIGQYREQVGDDPAIEASRLSSSLGLSFSPLELGHLTISPRLDLRATAYLGQTLQQSQESLDASIGLSWGDLDVDYDLVVVRGSSPFDFDADVAIHQIDLSFTRKGWATLNLLGGFDLASWEPDPVQAKLRWSFGADWTLDAKYRLTDAVLESVTLLGEWQSDALEVSLSLPYRPATSTFGTLVMSANVSGEWLELSSTAKLTDGRLSAKTDLKASGTVGPLEFSGTLRIRDLVFDQLDAAAEFTSDAGWGGKLQWEYAGGPVSYDQLLYGVFWDIGGCLRIGIDREKTDTWVYISILAFPDAVLRYAPQSARVEAGS